MAKLTTDEVYPKDVFANVDKIRIDRAGMLRLLKVMRTAHYE